jgi:DNA mismatch endonuclease (patch repair protein)
MRARTRRTTDATRTVSLGGGQVVPYPDPRDSAATSVAKGNRRRDTKPEIALRSVLHRRGLRFRKDLLLRVGDLKIRPDVVFTGAKVVVFVDGCFWHGCPQHQKVPKRNPDYWVPKLRRNTERDRRADRELLTEGWRVVRVWEHEDPSQAADSIEALVR